MIPSYIDFVPVIARGEEKSLSCYFKGSGSPASHHQSGECAHCWDEATTKGCHSLFTAKRRFHVSMRVELLRTKMSFQHFDLDDYNVNLASATTYFFLEHATRRCCGHHSRSRAACCVQRPSLIHAVSIESSTEANPLAMLPSMMSSRAAHASA